MKLLIVRHGDPDYSIDSLTPTGWAEAECLVPRMEKLDVKAFYVSPLGRARDTAAATMHTHANIALFISSVSFAFSVFLTANRHLPIIRSHSRP